jgi:hypothetical protein
MLKNPIRITLLDFLFIILLWALALIKCAPTPQHYSHSVPEADTPVSSAEDIGGDTPGGMYTTGPDPCVECDWYFCPPLDAVWQKQICINTCNNPPTVSYEGDCEKYFECDPTIYNQGSQDCTTNNGLPGDQEIYCNKGHYAYGECSTECKEEVCDYADNDCDGAIDEGQENECHTCGPTPPEICDDTDNDCDGSIDEGIIQECFTPCGKGVEYCVEGSWAACTSPPVEKEICNNIDDDCDGAIDENLDCGCTQDMVGVLIPCAEEPLICGQGFKSCICETPNCESFIITPCQAACVYYPNLDPSCDPLMGMELTQEACNKFDDDCDTEIDEDLLSPCYTGEDGTEGVGTCMPGEVICIGGVWGNYLGGEFQPSFCSGEILPEESDTCNGADEDCDGLIDGGKDLQGTDILFIVDWSGSMGVEINAVKQALSMFASNYSDEEVIQWGMIIGPVTKTGSIETLEFLTNLTDFQSFISALVTNAPSLSGGREMLYDAVYLALFSASSAADPPDKSVLTWKNKVSSSPIINNFKVSWREDSKKVIIIFTDEKGQSYILPSITQENIVNTSQSVEDLKIYTFTNEFSKENSTLEDGWEPLATSVGGKWFELTQDTGTMYSNLIDILDENICE